MRRSKATLKEIGERCGVTATTASAVLRGRRGGIRYSAETRHRVLEAARELNYQPNILAQAMVSGQAPIVALALHSAESAPFSLYTYDNLQQASLAFHRRGFETLYLPARSLAEEVERLRTLVHGGLISGLVTNILPGSIDPLLAFLDKTATPAVFLGKLPDGVAASLALDTRPEREILLQWAVDHGYRRIVEACYHADLDGKLKLDFEPWNGDDLLTPEEMRELPADAVILSMGESLTHRLRARWPHLADRIWTMEDSRHPPQVYPLILARSSQGQRMRQAVDILLRAIGERRLPEKRHHSVPVSTAGIQFIEKGPLP